MIDPQNYFSFSLFLFFNGTKIITKHEIKGCHHKLIVGVFISKLSDLNFRGLLTSTDFIFLFRMQFICSSIRLIIFLILSVTWYSNHLQFHRNLREYASFYFSFSIYVNTRKTFLLGLPKLNYFDLSNFSYMLTYLKINIIKIDIRHFLVKFNKNYR